jgi:hypothetical protein
LFLSDGRTAVASGQFISLAQGAAGLKFTPAANSTAPGSFDVQSSTGTSAAGLVGSVVVATISIAAPPSSSVTTPAMRTPETSFTISWSGIPGSSATTIAAYNLFVSTDGGPFTTWLAGTTATSSTYSGQLGHSYGFISQAIDSDGNVEPLHASADTTIVTTATPWQNPNNPLDVDGDGSVTPSDALAIINFLNAPGYDPALPSNAAAGANYLGVLGSDSVIPEDALQVIDYLNANGVADVLSPAAATVFDTTSAAATAPGTKDAVFTINSAANPNPASQAATGSSFTLQALGFAASPAVVPTGLNAGARAITSTAGSAASLPGGAPLTAAAQLSAGPTPAAGRWLKPSAAQASAVDAVLSKLASE